jgi:hypothetical protein
MTLRQGHGTGAGQPRIEVLPPDELPAGIPAAVQPASKDARTEDGKLKKGARTIPSLGGQARKNTTRLSAKLSLATLLEDPEFKPYKRAADDFRRLQIRTLAQNVGGGLCGPAPSSVVATAALQLAASRYLFDNARGEDARIKLASQLGNDSRQNLLAAHELCAREAKGRPAPATTVDWLVAQGEPAALPAHTDPATDPTE